MSPRYCFWDIDERSREAAEMIVMPGLVPGIHVFTTSPQ
jgi:hypothetical protein